MSGPPYITITPTSIITPLPTTTFGNALDNLTQSHYSLLYFPSDVLSPFAWTTMGQLAIPYFLIFFFIYLGLFIGHGNLRMASIIGLIFGGAFLFTGGILGVGFPSAVIPVAYGSLIASIAGIVMSIFKST